MPKKRDKIWKNCTKSFYCIHDKNTKFHLNFLSVLFKIKRKFVNRLTDWQIHQNLINQDLGGI